MPFASDLVLWLFAVTLGVASGAALYEGRVVIPLWTRTVTGAFHWNADICRRSDTAGRFWHFVATVPLTLLALAGLYLGWREPGLRQAWWLAAAALVVAERAATFLYFAPALVRLQSVRPSDPTIDATVLRWIRLNRVRVAVILVAWLAALRALTL